ncbi:MAG TPA: S8 family serine peptidase, partial [Tahibacter sp.]|nr:S8 family serine peptidase [Tahibacter sp.]
ARTGADTTQGGLAIVQFEAGRLDGRRAFAGLGADIVGYVPNNAYLVRLGRANLQALRKIDGVRWAGVYEAGYKVDPKLWTGRRATLEANADQRYELEISGFAGQQLDDAATTLSKQVPGLHITNRTEDRFVPTLRVSVAAGDLARTVAAAAALDAVGYVEHYLEPRLSNSASIATIQGNASGNPAGSGAVGTPTPLWDHQITGSNQIVAVMDSGLDRNEAWFTTLDKGAGPVTMLTDAESPVPPALGTLHPNNKIYGYFVQPGSTPYDSNATCPGGSPISYHGTHVAGSVAGDAAGTFGAATYLAATPLAANHELADGMAPNAQLLFQDIGNDTTGCLAIQDFGSTIAQAHAAGASIHSDSWGSRSNGAYTTSDAVADAQVREADTMLMVVAAGNEGEAGGFLGACPTGQTQPIPGDGFGKYLCLQTTNSPANGKNVLTVGATSHGGNGKMAAFSSRGPTVDGRYKPDIVAPGSAIISAMGDTNNGSTIEAPASKSLDGTSMAAPTISGNAALVRQFYGDGLYPRGERTPADTLNPSGALLKAVLLNGATPALTNAGTDNTVLAWPNIHSGWGRAWLDANLWFKTPSTGGDDSRRTRLIDRPNAAGLKTGESDSFTIRNVEAGKELRVTLTWFDPQSASAAGATLVNNLDLEVAGPDGSVYKGNVLTDSQSVTGGSADVLNTVEQVRLLTPIAGSYTVTVRGSTVPGNGQIDSDAQGYALAVSGGLGLPDAP